MRALAFTQRVDSQIPMHQKSALARHGLFNFFLSHLNYLLVALPNKTKHRHFNLAEDGKEQEGSWRTTFNFLAKVVSKPKNAIKTYKEATDLQKRNLRRTSKPIPLELIKNNHSNWNFIKIKSRKFNGLNVTNYQSINSKKNHS
jgi:hypothetical protein